MAKATFHQFIDLTEMTEISAVSILFNTEFRKMNKRETLLELLRIQCLQVGQNKKLIYIHKIDLVFYNCDSFCKRSRIFFCHLSKNFQYFFFVPLSRNT